MTTIGKTTLQHAVRAAHQGVSGLEQHLNAADSRLGDGDTGSMLARVIVRLNEVDLDAAPDMGASFALLARAAVSATGSSLGTLFATALMTLGKETKGRATIDWPEMGGLLAKARDAMIARGGAKLGDNTVLDALHAVAEAIDGRDQPAVRIQALQAVKDTLDHFRALPCQIGRARMFGAKSVGFDDPGMLAFAELAQCLMA
jgi:dihydroxyacetone kinase-like protein